MTWSLRKALSFGRFFRLNLSKVGASVGVKGARVGIGPKGKYAHLGRGGIYFRESLESKGPADETENTGQRLLKERPPGWEYLFFAFALDQSLGLTREEFRSGPERDRASLTSEEALAETSALLGVLQSSCSRMTEILNGDLQVAVGPPGKPGDPEALIAAAFAVGHEYLLLVDAKRRAHSIPSKSYFVPIRAEIGKSVDGICSVVDSLPADIRRGINESVEAKRSGHPQQPTLNLTFKIVNEDELAAAAKLATDGVRQELGL